VKQECPIVNIYVNWVLYLGVLGFVIHRRDWVFAAVWVVAAPAAVWLYVRNFPKISHLIGYGKIEDKPAAASATAATKVRLYTALGCPFCPVVEQRLRALETKMGFTLEKVDVTLKPELLSSKGIRSVPVVEVAEWRLVGNATTEQLWELVGGVREAARTT
jgi:glutaredoxin